MAAGLRDLENRNLTIEALLVVIAAPRLTAAGIELPPVPAFAAETAEIELFQQVSDRYPAEAHSRYNSLLQRLVSFECALERSRATRNSVAS